MTEQNPLEGSQKPEHPLDLTKAREAADKAADDTAQVVNQYFGTELKSSQVRNLSGLAASALLTAGIAYFAGKRGVKSGMKDYIIAGQSLVETAGRYADISNQNAESSAYYVKMLADSAAPLHEKLDATTKALGKLKK